MVLPDRITRDLDVTLQQHIEEFACAFSKKTGLDPTQIVMVVRPLPTIEGFGYEITFRKKGEQDAR